MPYGPRNKASHGGMTSLKAACLPAQAVRCAAWAGAMGFLAAAAPVMAQSAAPVVRESGVLQPVSMDIVEDDEIRAGQLQVNLSESLGAFRAL